MRVFFADQSCNFDRFLNELMAKPTMKFDRSRLKEKTTTIEIQTEKQINALNFDFLFDYDIFPSNILTYRTQWAFEKREMRVGDTILQQAFIPPIKSFSQKIIFGVRINNVINEANRKGFSYETIEGHVERGESIFTIEKIDKLIFKIRTFSEPGNSLTKLVGPFFTVPYQTYCTAKALKHVKHRIEMM